MSFHYFFQSEAHVQQHALAILALGLDWTQSAEMLQQYPLWKDVGTRNKEIVASIRGEQILF